MMKWSDYMYKFDFYDIVFSQMSDFCSECGFPCDYPDLCPYEVRYRMCTISLTMILDDLY